ncbi:hypothetical protein PVL29_016633 [Vitis rotundifolia]|uniref:Uncharacterized protein n=1 Tax=Vitis rotundifolia TaxID=103349 RepID=A0AA38Z8J8_VITRO|nr:hypothetical protein PVL29_016633 [Vitis rotundifolia]
MTSNSNSSFDALEWVIQIRRTLDEELEDYSDVPVCIFNVPKTLMATMPDCYVPQEVALGPYHHWRPELYEMERYKLAAAKRIQKHLQSLKFHSLVDQLTKHEPRIRACYHKFLEFNGETLAWMMAIDASFLLEFLQVYAMKEGRMLTRVSSRMSHLVDYAGAKSAHNAILRDMVMLENQIPLFVLRQEGKEESFGDSSYRIIFSKPVKFILKLPWTIVSNLPGFAILKQPVEYFFFSQDKEENKPENGNSKSNSSIVKPPLIEEITIPSVSELSKSGVRFLPTNGGISSITFDAKMVTLYLPTVSLDVNTEVTLRNLVAYESSNASGPLVITRYTELMNGIIDTKEDAKFLRERGIILNRLKSDEEVANLWNGMSKSIRLTKVPFLDKAIEDVNKYHSGRWKVKAGKFMKRYVFGSWQFLTFLAAILIVLLMTLQAFCSVYSCPRIFNVASD